jgi:hypothetical protein
MAANYSAAREKYAAVGAVFGLSLDGLPEGWRPGACGRRWRNSGAVWDHGNARQPGRG